MHLKIIIQIIKSGLALVSALAAILAGTASSQPAGSHPQMQFNDFVWPDSPATSKVNSLYEMHSTTAVRFQPDWRQVPGGFWAKRFRQLRDSGVRYVLIVLSAYDGWSADTISSKAEHIANQAKAAGLRVEFNCGNELPIFRDPPNGNANGWRRNEIARLRTMADAARELRAAGYVTHQPSIGNPNDRTFDTQIDWYERLFARLSADEEVVDILKSFGGDPCVSVYTFASSPDQAVSQLDQLRRLIHGNLQSIFGKTPIWTEWGWDSSYTRGQPRQPFIDATAVFLKSKSIKGGYYFVAAGDPRKAPTSIYGLDGDVIN